MREFDVPRHQICASGNAFDTLNCNSYIGDAQFLKFLDRSSPYLCSVQEEDIQFHQLFHYDGCH